MAAAPPQPPTPVCADTAPPHPDISGSSCLCRHPEGMTRGALAVWDQPAPALWVWPQGVTALRPCTDQGKQALPTAVAVAVLVSGWAGRQAAPTGGACPAARTQPSELSSRVLPQMGPGSLFHPLKATLEQTQPAVLRGARVFLQQKSSASLSNGGAV